MRAPTILASVPAGVLQLAVALGWDREALAAEAGMDLALLDEPDARVPLAYDLGLWTVLSREPVGLAIGERLGVAAMGVLGYAMLHGSTAGQALEWLGRYRALLHPELLPRMDRSRGPEGDRVLFSKAVPAPFARLREPVYAQAAATVSGLRALTGRAALGARSVAFPMPRPDDPARIEAYFRCPVSWGAPEFTMAFDAALLELPLPRSDAQLFGYLERRADDLLAQVPAESGITVRARREIAALLPHGEPRLGALAKRLAMSGRTVHRRLADEGTGFAALVEEVRRERAELLLDEPRLSCSEIGFLVGYAEPAAFFRAFKRWTGMTPQAWRAARRARREGAPAG
jgi:AraC-like DNA-binding protein